MLSLPLADKLSSLAEPTGVSPVRPTLPQCFHSSSRGAYMKIASGPQATTAASGNQPGWCARKTNTALAADLGCPGSQLGCPPGLGPPALESQGKTGQEKTSWSQSIHQSWGCCPVLSLWGHQGWWLLDTLLSRDLARESGC